MPRLPGPTLLAALVLLGGCPQERPGAEKQIPPQRVPPAVSLDPAPAAAGPARPPATDRPDAGAATR